MANVRHPNILEISKFCKTVEAAYNYAKNCGFVVDVLLSADAQSTQNTAHCMLLDHDVRELCTIQLFASCQRFDATAVRSIAVQ